MGYRGKLREQDEARRLRAAGKTLQQIATELHVSKSSVSIWVRDVPFTPSKRRYGPRRRPSSLHLRKLAEIEECRRLAARMLGEIDERAFLAAGIALYAGEGSKTDGEVRFANTDAAMVSFYCAWLRRFFAIDESRLRVRVYLHEGLDLDEAESHWAEITGVPRSQFTKPYRPVANESIRHTKHVMGCVYVNYGCSRTHRLIVGLMSALLSSETYSGVAQSAEQRTVNATAVGSSPTPGATSTRRVPLFVPYATPGGQHEGVG
jgi:transcriptional regulator with XRE-family HTH domain